MKDKILYLILGILIGAVITAGCFLVFSKTKAPQMNGERPEVSERGEMKKRDNENFVTHEDINTIPETTVE